MLKQHAKLVRQLVYLSDVALTAAAFFLAFWTRDTILPAVVPELFPTGLFAIGAYLKIFPIVLVIWSLLFFSHHSYHSHRTTSLRREIRDVLRIVGVGTLLLAAIAWFVPLRLLSRSFFILFVVFAILLLGLNRVGIRVLARYVRMKGMNYRTILVVGTGRRAREMTDLRFSAGHMTDQYESLLEELCRKDHASAMTAASSP